MTIKIDVDVSKFVGTITQAASVVIRKITYDIHAQIITRITSGPKTGRIYRRKRGGRTITHQASAPGESPASDSGHLRLTTQVTPFTNPLFGEVVVSAAYAAALEYGYAKRNLEPRPYIMPSIDDVLSRIQAGPRTVIP